MEIIAQGTSVKLSTRKVRLVAGLLRNLSAKEAIDKLSLVSKRPARSLMQIIKSAIANAIHNGKLKEDSLIIKRVDVTEGPALKRFRPSTRGRVHKYKKRSSHIRVILEERKKGN